MKTPLKRILVPVDGSDGACAAARFAGSIAETTHASITLLHVYDSAAVALMGLSTVSGKDLDDAIDRVSRAHLDAAREALGAVPVEVQVSVRIGDPAHEIVSCADGGDFDLIVIGCARVAAAETLGSVAQRLRVMRTAPSRSALSARAAVAM